MLKFTEGNILEAKVEALVNTVNCVGIMGKGIALQFKENFPGNFKQYREACQHNEVKIGKMFVVRQLLDVKYIINFPTKKHWKENSKIAYIKDGLKDLKEKISQYKIKSIAIPPLGCGLGGLNWDQIKPLMIQELSDLEDVSIHIYEPLKLNIPDW